MGAALARRRDLALSGSAAASQYWLTRFALLRLLGFVYAVAFLAAARELVPLIGSDGLLPLAPYLDRVAEHAGSRADGFWLLPSLFWVEIGRASCRERVYVLV